MIDAFLYNDIFAFIMFCIFVCAFFILGGFIFSLVVDRIDSKHKREKEREEREREKD